MVFLKSFLTNVKLKHFGSIVYNELMELDGNDELDFELDL
jgi:hypothetical protein